jgi:hypothetical protein
MTALSRRRILGLIASVGLVPKKMLAADVSKGGDDRGPFGLTWATTVAQVRSIGVALSANASKDFGDAYSATNLPKVIEDANAILLAFGYDDKLWHVAAVGPTIDNDPAGTQVLARFAELNHALAARYGVGKETDIRDNEMFKETKEYVASLKTGRAHRYVSFDNDSTSVELSIRANSFDAAFWVMIFESNAGSKAFKASKNQHEKDAL